MMNHDDLLRQAQRFLYEEARLLDERRWDDWLALYDVSAVYWLPAWKDEQEMTSDPASEISLIYYANRSGLEERVWRIRTNQSIASAVPPRTQHSINNVTLLPESTPERLEIACNWTVLQYQPRDQVVETFFGRYRQSLVRRGDGWVIVRKHIVLLNDLLPAKLDFYNI